MSTALVICQALGLAAACGIRPFLPALAAGALASANKGLDFNHTDVSFLERPGFLAAVLVLLLVAVFVERRDGPLVAQRGPLLAAYGGIVIGIGALESGGSLADEGHSLLLGIAIGVVAAAIAAAAADRVLAGAARRLDEGTRRALPAYADGVSLLVAAGSILAPPIGAIALIFLAVLLLRGRGREDERYAGLRSLR